MLDILEKFLIRKGYCFSRLDGTTPMSSRQSLVDDFNRSPSRQVIDFLEYNNCIILFNGVKQLACPAHLVNINK